MTTSGAWKLSPPSSFQQKFSGWIPIVMRTLSNCDTSACARKLPEYTKFIA